MRVDKVAAVPLDGQAGAAEAGALPGVLGAVIDLSVAHTEVLDATSGDIDFRVLLGNAAAEAPSTTEEACPADYVRELGEAEAAEAPFPGLVPAPAPAPAPISSAPGAQYAAGTLLSAALMGLVGALLL